MSYWLFIYIFLYYDSLIFIEAHGDRISLYAPALVISAILISIGWRFRDAAIYFIHFAASSEISLRLTRNFSLSGIDKSAGYIFRIAYSN